MKEDLGMFGTEINVGHKPNSTDDGTDFSSVVEHKHNFHLWIYRWNDSQ